MIELQLNTSKYKQKGFQTLMLLVVTTCIYFLSERRISSIAESGVNSVSSILMTAYITFSILSFVLGVVFVITLGTTLLDLYKLSVHKSNHFFHVTKEQLIFREPFELKAKTLSFSELSTIRVKIKSQLAIVEISTFSAVQKRKTYKLHTFPEDTKKLKEHIKKCNTKVSVEMVLKSGNLKLT